MKQTFFALTVLFSVIIFSGCKMNSNKEKTLDDLLSHFKSNGFVGEKSSKAFAFIGATDGCLYSNEDISVEVYKFADSKNMWEKLPYKNGNFGMLIYKPTEGEINKKIISIFEQF
jgi:hypothetical protein